MKKLLIIVLMMITLPAFSKIADSKNFYISADNMLMLSLETLNSLKYKIVEVQSSSGYILFKTPQGFEYLLMITKTGNTNSNVKIMKVKKTAPLAEIQKTVFEALTNEAQNIPIEVK